MIIRKHIYAALQTSAFTGLLSVDRTGDGQKDSPKDVFTATHTKGHRLCRRRYLCGLTVVARLHCPGQNHAAVNAASVVCSRFEWTSACSWSLPSRGWKRLKEAVGDSWFIASLVAGCMPMLGDSSRSSWTASTTHMSTPYHLNKPSSSMLLVLK